MNSRLKSISILILFFICAYLDYANYQFSIQVISVGIIISAIALYLSSEQFLDNSRALGYRYGLRGKHVGFYLVSVAAIVDEIFVVSIALSRGYGEIAFGTIQGSNVISLALFLLFLPLMYAAPLRKNRRDSAVIFVSAILLIAAAVKGTFLLATAVGAALIALFAIYIVLDLRFPGSEKQESVEDEKFSIPSMVIAVGALFVASDLLVILTGETVDHLGLSGFAAGFIFPGIVGTLPELVMFVLSHRRYNQEATVGVVTGTTIYKGTLLLGLAMIISDVNVSAGTDSVLALTVLASVLLGYSLLARERKVGSLRS
ncbi:MAG TPA: hypothetical protein VKU79_00690 [Thermoplasmataceae archaeon]|nr:hypothetical protein [Thermoplasmatales archaeon AK]HLH85366.1 hypothetical protein [Thermoplasmataceae archaeon]